MGHSMSDPGNYRTRAEIEKYQERDPIKVFTATLKDNGVLTDKEIVDFEAQVKEEVERSVRFAEESPEPDPSELYTNVYANPLES
jgi:pyruvate dehydrogenase E1 component alpha subunit